MVFRTKDLKQKGPARIVTNSASATSRNFTLGQDGDRLILRLRTTRSGANGDKPEVFLARLKSDEVVILVVNYEANKLEAWMNGRKLNLPAQAGELSNWENMPVLIGNEHKVDRPWKGSVYRVYLVNSTIDPDAAMRWTTPRDSKKKKKR